MPSNLWNRNYGLLLVITFCSGLTAQLLNTALPLYLVNALGTTTTISGVLSGLYTIVSCMARPFCGHLVDRMGRRQFIILGMSVFALGCFGFGLVTAAAMLVFFRLMQGLGFGISATASSTAASDNIPAARLGEGLGYLGMSNALPMVIGPSFALLLIADSAYARPFFLAGCLCILAGILAFLTREDPEMLASVRQANSSKQFTWRSLYESTALPPSLIQLFLSFAAACVMVFGALFAQSRGYDNISLFFIVSALSMLLVRMAVSKLVDRVNAYGFIIPACFLWSLGYVVLLLVDNSSVFLLVGILYGASLGVAQTMLNTVALRGVPPERRGAASATFLLCFDCGIGLGALLLGVVIDLTGYQGMIAVGTISLLIGGILSIVFWLRGGGVPSAQDRV